MFGKLVLCVSLLLAITSPALADTGVVVLGLRSIEGDDEVANDLTEQLRKAAHSIESWSVSSAAVSMAQMSLAHGCDEIDAACLSEIASGLHADKVVYGTIHRTSAREDYDFAINLDLFDATTGAIVRQVDDTLPRSETAFQALAGRAAKLLARLAAVTSGGGIEIQANVTDAEVSVNGQQVGTTRDGALRLAGLQPGRYRIEIRKQGYVPHVSTVSVVEGADTSIAAVLSVQGAAPASGEASPTVRSHGHHLEWLGWTLIGLSAASFVGTGVSLAVIDGINSDSVYLKYRDAVARGNRQVIASNLPQDVNNDVCKAAAAGNSYNLTGSEVTQVQSKCNTASTFEVLQWVFLGTALVSGAVGTYLVLSADHGSVHDPDADALERQPRLSLHPAFGPGTAFVSTTLRF
jgi:hypothetical protein